MRLVISRMGFYIWLSAFVMLAISMFRLSLFWRHPYEFVSDWGFPLEPIAVVVSIVGAFLWQWFAD